MMTALILSNLNKSKRKILSWLCILSMIFNMLPVTSFASGIDDAYEEPAQEVQAVVPANDEPELPAAPATQEQEPSQDAPASDLPEANEGIPAATEGTPSAENEKPAAEQEEEKKEDLTNDADIVPDAAILEPGVADTSSDDQDTPAVVEDAIPPLFVGFPFTGTLDSENKTVSYKYTSARNEDIVIDLDNIAVNVEVKYLDDETPVEAVKEEDEEAGHVYYHLSVLKDEEYLICLSSDDIEESITYTISLSVYKDTDTEDAQAEPDDGSALIDIVPEAPVDEPEDKTNNNTNENNEPDAGITDIFPDVPASDDTSVFDAFLNGDTDNTDPVEGNQEENNQEEAPTAQEAPVEPEAIDDGKDDSHANDDNGQQEEDNQKEAPTAQEDPVEPETVDDGENDSHANDDNGQQEEENNDAVIDVPDDVTDDEDNNTEENKDTEELPPAEAENGTSALDDTPSPATEQEEPADSDANAPDNLEAFLVTDDEEDLSADESADGDAADKENEDYDSKDSAEADPENPKPEETEDNPVDNEKADAPDEKANDSDNDKEDKAADAKGAKENASDTDGEGDPADESDGAKRGLDDQEEGEDPDGEPEDTSEDNDEGPADDGVLTYTINGLTITAETSEENELPEGASVTIEEISNSDSRYGTYKTAVAETEDIDASNVTIRVFDIHFESEGEEVAIAEGSPDVRFVMSFDEAIELEENHTAPFYHVTASGLVKLVNNTADETGAISSFEFTTGSCSDFILADIDTTEQPVEPAFRDTYVCDSVEGLVVTATTTQENEIPDDAELVVTVVSASEGRVGTYKTAIANSYNVGENCITLSVYDMHFELEGSEVPIAAGEVNFAFALATPITLDENHEAPFYHVVDGELVTLLSSADNDGIVSSFEFAVASCSDFILADVNTVDYDEDNKYAILYSNGDLVIQDGNRVDPSRGSSIGVWICPNGITQKEWANDSNISKVKNVYINTSIKFPSSSLFSGMSQLEYIYNIENIDLSNLTSLQSAFYNCQKLKHIYGLAEWDTHRIASLNMAFCGCYVLDNINDISGWNLNITSTSGLYQAFMYCRRLETLDMSGWDLSKITSLYYTFYDCNYLRHVDFGNIFSNVTANITLQYAFMYCYSLEDVDTLFDNCSNAYLYQTFYNCSNLENVDLSGTRIRSLYYTFYNCLKLKTVDLSGCSMAGIGWEYAFAYDSQLRSINMEGMELSGTCSSLTGTFYSTPKLSYINLGFPYFTSGSTGTNTNTFGNSGVSRISLSSAFKFAGSSLPSGSWRRVSTNEIYTADELKQAWNSSMADTYERVHVVTFDANGGVVEPPKVIKQLDELIEESDFPTATLDGFTFAGWFTEKSGGTELKAGDPITQSVYYAHWDENAYTLILKRNVEDDPNDTELRVPLTYTEVYQLSPDLFENDDKVIQGWTTNADGTGTQYGADERISWLTPVDGGEAYLYAKWGRTHDATISFDSQGGSPVDNVLIERGQTFLKGDYVTPKREGYTFDGWWTDPEGGERWDTSDHLITSSQQLYAHWIQNPIISFNPNGGWISTFSKEVPYGGSLESIPWGDDRIKKFMGFYTEPEEGAGEKLTTSTTFTEDATYYAHWGYQPTFNLAGGNYAQAFSVDAVYPITENNMIEITAFPEVEYDGYQLVRWKLGDGSTVNIGDIIDNSVYSEIIAEWEHTDTVKVTFDATPGYLSEYGYSNSGGTESLSIVYEMDKDTPLGYYPDAYRYVNYRRWDFLGWYNDDDELVTRDTIISEDITLHAKYKGTTNTTYNFIVPTMNYRATGDSYTTTTYQGNQERLTRIYRNKGDTIGIIPGLEAMNGATLKGKYLEGWYSDRDPFEEDGVTLKEGVEKLTADTVKETDSTWYAHIVNNVVDKTNDIVAYKFYAEWVNASNSVLTNVDNRLDFHPTSSNDQTASLHLHFELNSQVSETLPVGSVRITIPKYIWEDWDGNVTGSVNLSTQMPQYPKSQSGMFFSYAEDEDGNYILLNNKEITGGAGVDMTLSYTVNPVEVRGGAVDRNKDYVEGYDYYSNTFPVVFEIDRDTETTYVEETIDGKKVVRLTNEYVADTQEILEFSNEMHTYVDPGIKKSHSKLYYQWQDEWGPRPDDAYDYFYMMWSVSTNINTNQPYVAYLTEDTVHDGTVVYISKDYATTPLEYKKRGDSTSPSMNVVTRHPLSMVESIPATGVTIRNQARLHVDWKSGYQTELVSPGEYTMYKWEYTVGEFDKSNKDYAFRHNYSNGRDGYRQQSSSVQTITGAQDLILNDTDVDLEWELHYDGVSADTPILWDEESQTYQRLQRIIAISDGVNGDLMYSSGEPYAKYVWEPMTGNVTLTDNDYTIKKLRIFVNEYDGTYHNGEWGGPILRSDYGLWKDIDIYVRYRNSNKLVFYKSVRPWATKKYNVGLSSQYGYTDVVLPSNVVGWEVRYPTSYYSTYLQVNMLATLHATADVKSYVQHDVLGGWNSEIKNRGYCNIWTSNDEMEDPDTWDIRFMLHNFTDDTYSAPQIFFHVTDYTGGLNGANKEIWELTKAQGSMYARKYTASHDRVLFDVERGIQQNPMCIMGWNYVSGSFTPVKTGRFYDLLPRGATVERDSIFAVLKKNNSTNYSSNLANSYTTALANTSSHLPKEYYNVQFVEDWESSGRTMMIIDYTAPTNTTNFAAFYYLLTVTYQDVVSYGTSMQNDVAFIDTTPQNKYSYAYSEQSTLGKDAYLYDTINALNNYVAYSYSPTDYIPVDAFSWGFYKSVKTQSGFMHEDITIPNNIYTYKINYSQSDYATVNSMVFFDVLERGAYSNVLDDSLCQLESESEWYGTFESIDITPLRTLVKDGSGTTSPIYCAPVVYYSTKARDQFTGSDWDVTNAETWTPTMPPKEEITAVAVDCTKATDGSPFVMFGRQSASFYINMRSSTNPEDVGKNTVNQAIFKGNINNEPSDATSDTVVTLTEEEPEIHKESNPVSGTADSPTILSAGDDLVYTITVKNKNEDFVVPDIVVEDEMPAGVQVNTTGIKVHYGNPSNALLVSESPRVSLTVRSNKLIFTLNTLDPEEVCYLIIPCKAKAAGSEIIENTAVITKVNGIDKEIESETTYHKVEFDIIFSKQSDIQKLVIGASLQLWEIVEGEEGEDAEEVLVDEWVSSTANRKIRLHTGSYILKEIEVPDGYALADDIAFDILDDGTVHFENGEEDTKVVMVDVASTTVNGAKLWKYDDEEDRPETITVRLMRKIEGQEQPAYSGKSITTSAEENWEYDFGLVQKYDTEGHEYIYSVEESPAVPGYTSYYTEQVATNGLELTFSNRTSTHDSNDKFTIFFPFGDKIFGKTYYGTPGESNNPAGTTIRIPATEFWVAFETDGADNDYGLKFDQIIPVHIEEADFIPTLPRIYPDSWMLTDTAEEYSGGRYPETDHNYFIYEKVMMHYSRDMEGYTLDIINVKNTTGFDIPINKVDEDGNKLGGVSMLLTSDAEIGDAVIDPVEWITEENESYVVTLFPGHYILHEVAPVAGYLYADDIHFVVNGEGQVEIGDSLFDSVDMVDMNVDQPYPFRKIWRDAGYESMRPESVTYNLIRVSDNEIVETKTLTSEDATGDYVWEGVFDPVPVVDEELSPIEYRVAEIIDNAYRPVYEIQNKTGFLVTFTDDSDIGSGKLYIYTLKRDEFYNSLVCSKQLSLNPQYLMTFAENTDMAGKTYFVPITDGVEGFAISREWVEDSVKLEIASIIPTTATYPATLSDAANTTIYSVYTGNNYPIVDDRMAASVSAYLWSDDILSSGQVEGSELVNYINRTNVPVTKIWDDEGFEDKRPETITLSLYNELDLETIVATKTFTVGTDNEETFVFEGVPKYNADWSEAHYVVKEQSLDNYFATYEKPKGMLVKFTDDSYISSGNSYGYILLTSVNGNSGSCSYYVAPAGYTSTAIQGTAVAGNTFYVPIETDGCYKFCILVGNYGEGRHLEIESVRLTTQTQELYKANMGMPITGIPENRKYVGNGSWDLTNLSNGQWCLYEYVPSASEGIAEGVVTNIYNKTRVPVKKLWNDTDYEDLRPEKVVVDAYNERDLSTVVGTAEITYNENIEENEWNGYVEDLPRFNSDGTEAVYVLRERPVDEYFTSYDVPVGMLVTISRDSFPVNYSSGYLYFAALAGDNTLGYIRPEEGYSNYQITKDVAERLNYQIYVPKNSNGNYEFAVCNYNTSPYTYMAIEKVELVTQAQYYSIYNMSMPVSNISESNIYTGHGLYNLTNKGGWHLYRFSDSDFDGDLPINKSTNGVITNSINKVDFEFVKTWIGDEYFPEFRPTELTFRIYNKLDPETTIAEQTLLQSETESGDEWHGVFEDLPKYNPDGTEAEYVVEETEVPDRYVLASANAGTLNDVKGLLVTFGPNTYTRNNASFYLWQDYGTFARNYVGPNGYIGTTLAGKQVFVPATSAGTVGFVVELGWGAANSQEAAFEITSIEPIFDLADVPSTAYKNISTTSGNDVPYAGAWYGHYIDEFITDTTEMSHVGLGSDQLWFSAYKLTPEFFVSPDNVKNQMIAYPVTINKYSNVYPSLPGAVLQLLKMPSESVIVEFETTLSDYTIELPVGTYMLREVTPAAGFDSAEDILFTVEEDGTITIDGEPVERVRMYDKEHLNVSGVKTWSNDTDEVRPASITVNLYRDGELYDSKVVTEADNWAYAWNNLDKYEGETSRKYEYTLDEDPVFDYQQVYVAQETDSWIPSSFSNGLLIKFSEASITESISYDWIYIYYKVDGQLRYYTTKFGGSGGTSYSLSGKEIFVPGNEFWLVFRTDSSATYYGFDVLNVTPAFANLSSLPYANATATALPTSDGSYSYTTSEYSGTNYPSTPHNYYNNTRKIYHYSYGAEISHGVPDPEDRDGSEIVANITNIRLPDKQEYSVYKQNPENELIEGAVLEITGHEDNASYDITPIRWTSSGDAPQTVELRAGQYVLHEVTPPAGYLQAADIPFVIDSEGKLIIEETEQEAIHMTDTPNLLSIPVSKVWDDAGFSEYRPASITFDLYDTADPETVVDTITLTAEDNWAGAFENIPYVREGTEEKIEYTVVERDVSYYDEEILANAGVIEVGVSENNQLKNFVYTPNYGLQINMSENTYTNGPLMIIWKDKSSGYWYSTSWGVSSNYKLRFHATEAYLLYRSYGNYVGLDIDSVTTFSQDTSLSNGGMASGGYIWLDEDIDDVLPKAIQKFQGTYDYWPTTLTSADFTDGSNGYHNSCADKDYQAEPVYQLVHVKRPSDTPSVITKVPTVQKIANAEGFRIQIGDDHTYPYGSNMIIWKTSDGTYKMTGCTFANGGTINVKSKEFYLLYCDSKVPEYDGIPADGTSTGIYGYGFSVSTATPVTGVTWDFDDDTSSNTSEYQSFQEALDNYVVSDKTIFSSCSPIDARNGTPVLDTRSPVVLAFDYSSIVPWYTYNDYYAEYGGFVEDPVTAKNTFNVPSSYDIQFEKVDSTGHKIAGAHLKLFTTGGTLVSEWDSSASAAHTENLEPGSYVLKETSTPTGYITSEDVAFTIDAVGRIFRNSSVVSIVSMTDEPIPPLLINKVDRDHQNNNLSGAVLKLYNSSNTMLHSWTSNGTAEDLSEYLAVGQTYRISESNAPAGYNKLSEDIVFQVASNGTITLNTTDWATLTGDATIGYTLKLFNQSGIEFPATGSSDRPWFYVGAILILVAAAVAAARRKRRYEGN